MAGHKWEVTSKKHIYRCRYCLRKMEDFGGETISQDEKDIGFHCPLNTAKTRAELKRIDK